MGRVRTEIKIKGRKCWTLFDTGARNTYILEDAAKGLVSWRLPQTEGAALGGRQYRITRECILIGEIRNYWVRTQARIVKEIGNDEEGRPIEILFGALAMQQWGIKVDPKHEKLDLTHYPREFVEFATI